MKNVIVVIGVRSIGQAIVPGVQQKMHLNCINIKLLSMKYQRIQPIEKKLVNVIIETPRESQNKFVYDPELRIFKLKKTLPMGTTFPFDFGFIPNTEGADGDPLDVMVIMDQHAFPGCLIQCRPLGI